MRIEPRPHGPILELPDDPRNRQRFDNTAIVCDVDGPTISITVIRDGLPIQLLRMQDLPADVPIDAPAIHDRIK